LKRGVIIDPGLGGGVVTRIAILLHITLDRWNSSPAALVDLIAADLSPESGGDKRRRERQRQREWERERQDMEVLVREQGAHLGHHICNKVLRLLFGDIQSHTVPHRPSQLAVVVSCQPIIAVSNEVRVGLADGGGMARSIKLRDDADPSRVSIRD
jgi:hypothetical protein